MGGLEWGFRLEGGRDHEYQAYGWADFCFMGGQTFVLLNKGGQFFILLMGGQIFVFLMGGQIFVLLMAEPWGGVGRSKPLPRDWRFWVLWLSSPLYTPEARALADFWSNRGL